MLHNPEVEGKNGLPTVSVIVLNYNGLKHLEDCFRSLEALRYPKERLEFIMVDNGSSDKSVEYVESNFPQVRIMRNAENLGFARGNNLAAQEASGQYLAFLNNDARVDPNWLIEFVKAVLKEEDIVCAAGRILSWDGKVIDFVGGALNFYGMGFQPEVGRKVEDVHLEEKEILFACGGSMLIERGVFLNCGGFDEDYFAYFEDVDLGWRLWVLGYRVTFVPTAISYHRGGATSKKFPTEKRSVLYERNALYTIVKNYEEENLRKVLPAALLLAVRRAVIFSGIDKRGYRMETVDDFSTIWPASPKDLALAKTERLNRELRWAVREYGLLTVAIEVVRRMLRWLYVQSVRRIWQDLDLLTRTGVSHLVAMDDLVDSLPRLMEKRNGIQARRKRADSEIFPLFVTPFHPHPPYPEYEKVQKRLADYMGIYEIFERGGCETPHH